MKLRLLTVILSLLTCSSAFVQHSISIKAGGNYSTRTFVKEGKRIPSYHGFVAGFHVGANYEYEINNYISFSSELLLNSKGYKRYDTIVTFDNSNPSSPWVGYPKEYNHNFRYIETSMSVKFKLPVNDELLLFSRLGGYLGYSILGNRTMIDFENTSNGHLFDEYQKSYNLDKLDENRLDIGLNLSIGVELKHFFLEGTYSQGIRNLLITTNTVSRNQSFLLSLGYRFEL